MPQIVRFLPDEKWKRLGRQILFVPSRSGKHTIQCHAGTSNFNFEILNFLSSNRGIMFAKKGTVAPSKKMFAIPCLKGWFWRSIFAIRSSDHSVTAPDNSSEYHFSFSASFDNAGSSATRVIVISRLKYSLENPVRANSAVRPFSFSRSSSISSLCKPPVSTLFLRLSSVSVTEYKYPSYPQCAYCSGKLRPYSAFLIRRSSNSLVKSQRVVNLLCKVRSKHFQFFLFYQECLTF